MNTKIHIKDIDPTEKYWYIYQGGGKCQLVHVIIEEDEYQGNFNVQISDGGDWFNSFPIKIDCDENGYIENLFLFSNHQDAEIIWCYQFIKNFRDNTFVEYSEFLRITRLLHEHHPELILKGI
jgi:hypothetical protein